MGAYLGGAAVKIRRCAVDHWGVATVGHLTPDPSMLTHRPLRLLLLAPLLASCLLPSAAQGETAAASSTVTGGGLTFINGTPGAVTFPSVTLNGTDQTTTQTQPLDISDARGTGVGWNVTATSTAFNNGGSSLPNNSTTVTATPTSACVPTVSCVTPTNSIPYPYTLPADAVAPTATKLYNAAAATGTGAVRVTPTWRLTVPATALVGTYNSTWTLSLVSGP